MKFQEYDIRTTCTTTRSTTDTEGGDHYILGVTEFAAKLAGDITYVDMPSEATGSR